MFHEISSYVLCVASSLKFRSGTYDSRNGIKIQLKSDAKNLNTFRGRQRTFSSPSHGAGEVTQE